MSNKRARTELESGDNDPTVTDVGPSGEEDQNAGLLYANNLIYTFPHDYSVCVNTTRKEQLFQQRQYFDGDTMQCTIMTGADYVDPLRSYIQFDIDVMLEAETTTGINPCTFNQCSFGRGGTACNLIREIIVDGRSGDELFRAKNFNVQQYTTMNYVYPQDWWDTVGRGMTEPTSATSSLCQMQNLGRSSQWADKLGDRSFATDPTTGLAEPTISVSTIADLNSAHVNGTTQTWATGRRRVTIPLYCIGGLFATDKLLPSPLVSGMVIRITLEQAKFATVWGESRVSSGLQPSTADKIRGYNKGLPPTAEVDTQLTSSESTKLKTLLEGNTDYMNYFAEHKDHVLNFNVTVDAKAAADESDITIFSWVSTKTARKTAVNNNSKPLLDALANLLDKDLYLYMNNTTSNRQLNNVHPDDAYVLTQTVAGPMVDTAPGVPAGNAKLTNLSPDVTVEAGGSFVVLRFKRIPAAKFYNTLADQYAQYVFSVDHLDIGTNSQPLPAGISDPQGLAAASWVDFTGTWLADVTTGGSGAAPSAPASSLTTQNFGFGVIVRSDELYDAKQIVSMSGDIHGDFEGSVINTSPGTATLFSGSRIMAPAVIKNCRYEISNPKIIAQTCQLTDAAQRSLNEVSASNGLEIVYYEWEHTQGPPDNHTDIHLEVRRAVSRAMKAFATIRDYNLVGAQTDLNVACTTNSMCTETYRTDSFYWQLGSLYFPHQRITGDSNAGVNKAQQQTVYNAYIEALDCFGRFAPKGNYSRVGLNDFLGIGSGDGKSSRPVQTSMGWEKVGSNALVHPYVHELQPYHNGLGVLGVTLERSSLFQLSGVPINNSRVLVLHAHFDRLQNDDITRTRVVDIFLKYVKIARVFMNMIETEA